LSGEDDTGGIMAHALPRYQLVALDCPDPLALAKFYSELTGLSVEPLGDFAPGDVDWIELDNGAHPCIAFQKIDDFVAPTWPDGPVPQQLHLDFIVDDLDAGEQHVLSIGATKHQVQPGSTFRVYLNPVGHPFCLVTGDD
jgi:Glyoxalase-like domain